MTEDLLSKLSTKYTQNLLEDIVRINSIIGQEEELAYYLKGELENLGLRCMLDEVESGRFNIYADLIGDRPGKKINFNGHLDTIPVVEGWETDPFNPIVKNGRLYGLGTCDMKGGIACTLNMLRAFVESDYQFKGKLSFSGVIDEEGYGKGARAMLKTEYAKVDAIIIPEPFPGDHTKPIPLGITGKILYDILVKGKAAHGFAPHLGVNAIEELAIIIANLHKLNFKKHPKFENGNYCTLKIEGGYEIYSVVVPALARVEINRLLVPGETRETVINDMLKLVKSLNLKAIVEVKTKLPEYQPFVISKNELLIRIFDPIYKQIMGKNPIYGYTTGITDANIFTGEGGIPCLHLGPSQTFAHQKNEFIELNSLLPLSKMYTLIAVNFLKNSK